MICMLGLPANFNARRLALQASFWAVMLILLMTILLNFINLSATDQLSAYDMTGMTCQPSERTSNPWALKPAPW